MDGDGQQYPKLDNNIPNKFDCSVPPTPLSVGGILYASSSAIRSERQLHHSARYLPT